MTAFLLLVLGFLWALVVLGLIADAIDRWAGGPDQRDSARRNGR